MRLPSFLVFLQGQVLKHGLLDVPLNLDFSLLLSRLLSLLLEIVITADTYYYIFATEDLGADLDLLGYIVTVTTVVGIIVWDLILYRHNVKGFIFKI